MSAAEIHLLTEIRRHIGADESVDDVVAMIGLLSVARADQRGTAAQDEVTPIGKFLCVVFDVFKTAAYRTYAIRFRKKFAGIATDEAKRLQLLSSVPTAFLTREPRQVFAAFGANQGDAVSAVASAYDIDEDKLRRLYAATARVLQLRLHLSAADSYAVVERVFRVCARERLRILNPYGWILDAAMTEGATGRRAEPSQSLETLIRDLDEGDADATGPDLLLEQ